MSKKNISALTIIGALFIPYNMYTATILHNKISSLNYCRFRKILRVSVFPIRCYNKRFFIFILLLSIIFVLVRILFEM